MLYINSDVSAHTVGRDVIFALKEDAGPALKTANGQQNEVDAILSKAAIILRRDMFKYETSFVGTFHKHCEEQSVPAILQQFIHQLLVTGDAICNQATLTVSQVMSHNSFISKRKGVIQHDNSKKEPPLPMHLRLAVHAKTRIRDLVGKLHHLGLSIPYEKMLNISTRLAQRTCDQFEQDRVVCPVNMRTSLFTTAVAENIDHNTSAITAESSFHGAGISLFQTQAY